MEDNWLAEDFSTLPSYDKNENMLPVQASYSHTNSLQGYGTTPASIPAVATPYDFSFLRTTNFPILGAPTEQPGSYAQPSKRRKIAACGSPVPSEPSDCCSSCSDGEPCVDPDCEAEEEGLPCLDPNCDIAQEEVIICSGDRGCSIPACTSQCVELPNAQSSLLGAGNWVENSGNGPSNHDRTSWRNHGFAQGTVQCPESLLGSCESSAPATPSLVHNLATPYSPHLDMQTPQAALSVHPDYSKQAGVVVISRSAIASGVPLSRTEDIFNQPWNDTGDQSAMFCCPWEGCSQSLESQDWMAHFHREHIDPQMTFRCPFQEETCPPVMDTNPLAHLESDHGYIFDANGNGYSCPSPSCPQDLTFCDPSTLHNHLDYAHATPDSGALRCRLNSCDNWFEDSNTLVSHVKQHHPLTSLLARDEAIDLSASIAYMADSKSWQLDTATQLAQPDAQKRPTITEERVGRENQEETGSDLVHSCKWTLHNDKVCQKSCSSEIDLQKHIKEAHLESLDHKTGYHCRWEGCMRDSKLGAKAGFSQRGKLERHMATHTNFKCSKCDICGKDFSAPQAMKQHRRLHTGERPWKCTHCDKTFAQQSACTVHERTHTSEKPLECPVCHKMFSESSNLAKHRKTHGEKGSHACTFAGCGKSYHRYDQLKRHLVMHAKAEDGSGVGGSEEGE